MKILPSVESVLFHKKDCRKMCDYKEKSKSQVGGSFGGPENLTVGSVISCKKDCHKMCGD